MNKKIPNQYIKEWDYGLSWQKYLTYYEKRGATEWYYAIARYRLNEIIKNRSEENEEKDLAEIMQVGATIKDMSQLGKMVDNILAEEKSQDLSKQSEELLQNFILGIHGYAELDEDLEKQQQQLEIFIQHLSNLFEDIKNSDFDFEKALQNLLGNNNFKLMNGDTLYKSFITFVKRLEKLNKQLGENSKYYKDNKGNITKIFYDIAFSKGTEEGIEYIKELHNEKIISDKQKTNIIAVLNGKKKKEELKWGSIAQYFNSIYNQIKGEFFEICELQALLNMINGMDDKVRNELETVHSGGTNTQGESDIIVVALESMNEEQRKEYKEKTQTEKAKFVRKLKLPYIGFNIKSFPKPEYDKNHAKEVLTTLKFTEWIKGQQAIDEGGWNLIHAMQLGFPSDRGDDVEFTNAINAAITSYNIEKIYGLHDNVRYIRFSNGIYNIYDYLRELIKDVNKSMYPIFFLKTSNTFRTEKDLMGSTAPIVLHDKQ